MSMVSSFPNPPTGVCREQPALQTLCVLDWDHLILPGEGCLPSLTEASGPGKENNNNKNKKTVGNNLAYSRPCHRWSFAGNKSTGSKEAAFSYTQRTPDAPGTVVSHPMAVIVNHSM